MRVIWPSPDPLARMHTMTERKGKSGTIDVKALLAGDEEFLRALVRTALQEVLEVEMAETLGAEKSERTAGRLGYRSGYYGRTLVTRIGKLELRVPRSLPRRRPGTAPAGSRPRCSRAISARSGRWWRRWRRCTCREFRPARSRRSPRSCAATASRPRRSAPG